MESFGVITKFVVAFIVMVKYFSARLLNLSYALYLTWYEIDPLLVSFPVNNNSDEEKLYDSNGFNTKLKFDISFVIVLLVLLISTSIADKSEPLSKKMH